MTFFFNFTEMKLFTTIFLVFVLCFGYSNSDSIKNINYWNQLSLLPDSNNYMLFFGGPSSINKSLFFNASNLSFLNDHPMFLREQEDMLNRWSDVPIVDFQYIIGPNLEQNLAVYHNQPISERSNYAISYLKRSHDGYYLNQSTNSNFIQANYFFNSKKYKLFFGGKHHRIYNQQNGGINNDSSFTNSNDEFLNRLLLDVNLNNAYSNDKLWKAFVNQSFLLSTNSDSILSCSSYLNFDINYTRKLRNYYDSLDSYSFLYNYYDSIKTNDSIMKDLWSAELNYTYNKSKDSSITFFSIGTRIDAVSHLNYSIDTLFYNHSIISNYSKESNKSKVSFSGEYFPFGFKKDNYNVYFDLKKYLSKKSILNLNFNMNNSRPTFELHNFFSNHNVWSNNFENLLLVAARANINLGKLSYDLNYSDIYNPIYFNYIGNPVQYVGSSQIIQSALKYSVSHKRINLFSEVVYQYQGGAQVFQLPEWIGQLQFNYKLTHEKSNSNLIFGVNGRCFSSFYLMNYLPSINQFSISNERLQSQYFTIDFIAKANIKQVSFYFMISHLNAGLLGYDYFTALHYPSPDRYMKFGLKWLFLN